MNMIECSEKCLYQQGGCCNLKGAVKVTNSDISPCKYFVPENKDERIMAEGSGNEDFNQDR